MLRDGYDWSVVVSTKSNQPMPLKEKIRAAREHAEKHGLLTDTLWPYQDFRLTIGELLDAAERGA